MINYFVITALINFLSSTVLGFLVFAKNKKSSLNKIFAIFCSGIALWSGFYFFWASAENKEVALLWGRALNTAAIIIAPAFLHFTALFLGIYPKIKKIILFGYFLSAILFISGFTPLFVKDVAPEATIPWYPKAGPTYHIFALMFFSYVAYSWYLMIKSSKGDNLKSNPLIKYVLIGTFIGFIGGSMNFLPVYGIQIPPYGNSLVALLAVTIGFAVLKYQLFDIKVVITEALVVMMLMVIAGIAFLAPTVEMKIIISFIFLAFCLVGFFLIKANYKEIKKKEEIERMASQLKELNKNLEQKVQERTQELQESNDELKRWYQLTIGRELRMAELKDKIKEMEEKR